MYQSVTNAISVKPGVAFFYFIQINSAMPDIINSIFQTSTVGQPFDFQADMDFVMYGRRDETALIIESLLGANYDNTKTYILKGCDVSSDGTTTTVTPGYIFGINKVWGNLVARTYAYFHPGSSFPDPTGSDVVVCTTTVTYPAGDPITFTDSSTHNVHMIINVTFSAGASGSGDVDYSDLLHLTLQEEQRGAINGATVDLKKSLNIEYSTGTVLATTINIDETSPIIGAEVSIVTLTNAGDVITTVMSAGGTLLVATGLASQTAASSGFFYIKYKYFGVVSGVNVFTAEFYNS